MSKPGPGCSQGLLLDAGQENVVTVFGFPNNEDTEAKVVQEFSKCGDILRYHTDRRCNWMHIQYGVRQAYLCMLYVALTMHAIEIWPQGMASASTSQLFTCLHVTCRPSMRLNEHC